MKITFFMIGIQKSLWKLPPPLFTGCCQEDMNSVFERDSQTCGANGEVQCESQTLFYYLYFNHPQQRLFPALSVTVSQCCIRHWNISLSLPSLNTHSPCLALTCFLGWEWGILRCVTCFRRPASPCLSTKGSSGPYNQVRN